MCIMGVWEWGSKKVKREEKLEEIMAVNFLNLIKDINLYM